MPVKRKTIHSDEPPILIIGAGVLGLSCANLIQQAHPTRSITIIAAEFPGDQSPSADFASAWAGAHYRPIPGSSRQLQDEAQLAQRTWGVMRRIASERGTEAGVELMKGQEYLERPGEVELGMSDGDPLVEGFRVLTRNELPRDGRVQWGCEYMTYCVNVPVYCGWLLANFRQRGGKVLRQRLKHAEDVLELAEKEGWGDVRTVVNCSGRNFDSDPKMKIVRGQTVLVRQQYSRTVTRQNSDGSWSFLIPRPSGGGTIVGGTKEIGDWESSPRADTRQKLLKQAIYAFPDFVETAERFEVIKDNVGRRPFREGGLRLEVETLNDGRQRIIHAYGIGGRGYETSWGIAERVVTMLEDIAGVTPV